MHKIVFKTKTNIFDMRPFSYTLWRKFFMCTYLETTLPKNHSSFNSGGVEEVSREDKWVSYLSVRKTRKLKKLKNEGFRMKECFFLLLKCGHLIESGVCVGDGTGVFRWWPEGPSKTLPGGDYTRPGCKRMKVRGSAGVWSDPTTLSPTDGDDGVGSRRGRWTVSVRWWQ